jgi:RIO kinase 1
MHIQAEDSASGQFEDDLGDLEKKVASVKLAQGLRPNIEAYIDDPDALLWDSSDEDEEYDSQFEAQAWDESLTRVDDEDWEIAEGGSPKHFSIRGSLTRATFEIDFTKSYNRLRQHVEVRTGKASGSSSKRTSVPVAHLPATNRPRVSKQKSAPDAIAGPAQKARTQSDQLAMLSKYNSRIVNITMPYTLGYGMGGVATNRKGASERANIKDKADRATNEQVLDPRTRIILFKMINRGLIEEVNGCVSTGKEVSHHWGSRTIQTHIKNHMGYFSPPQANVYHALTPEGRHLALKLYKTSILVFKDRDKYVTGEHRFRNGYSRHNPRKMVKMWAEKEMRNLKRLAAAGIRCPEVLEVKENVLVISFLGNGEGWYVWI